MLNRRSYDAGFKARVAMEVVGRANDFRNNRPVGLYTSFWL
jgi:hypothetical protein